MRLCRRSGKLWVADMATIIKSPPVILHAIVGTAGHVDHGKTSLVRLLTGCETDRLPEEKARGMSIDLGFAPCLLHGRRVVGIVDVPGHKDFIRNMVAGASSIDVLLLVVAADDGVMPQTDEHMKIVNLLRSPQVMVALTKIDMVSAEMVELARQDVASFLASAGYPNAPIIAVSNKTGEGIGEIRDTIDSLVEQVRTRAPDSRAFRMNDERVFSVKGYGTVATGIPVSGQVALGEKLELLPTGRELTVRTVQSYKQESNAAVANCCCAINVRDVDAQLVMRGMALASPDIYRSTTQLIVHLVNSCADLMLKRRFEATLHSGTSAIAASVKLLQVEMLAPGEDGFGHVMLDEPLTIAAGDRFILRQASPGTTLGGGTVLSVREQRLRRHEEVSQRLSLSRQFARSGDHLMAELLAGPGAIVPASEAIRLTQCPRESAQARLAAAVTAGHITELAGAYLVTSRIAEVAERLRGSLSRYHQANPYAWGMTANHVCEELALQPRAFAALSPLLVPFGMRVKHGRLALESFKPPISERLMQLRDTLLHAIKEAGVLGPARGDLMKQHGIVEADMKLLTKLLLGDGSVLLIDGNFILREVFDQSRATLIGLFAGREVVDISAFREAIGGTRKVAVAMLDAFDVEGVTRRVPAGRVLVNPRQATSSDPSRQEEPPPAPRSSAVPAPPTPHAPAPSPSHPSSPGSALRLP